MIKLTDIAKEILLEDRCKRIANRKYSKPSAYKSGAIVRCRKGNIWKGLKEKIVCYCYGCCSPLTEGRKDEQKMKSALASYARSFAVAVLTAYSMGQTEVEDLAVAGLIAILGLVS